MRRVVQRGPGFSTSAIAWLNGLSAEPGDHPIARSWGSPHMAGYRRRRLASAALWPATPSLSAC